jgi:hypothetical protein
MCDFLHSPLSFFLRGPNIFLSTLFSSTLSIYRHLNVRYEVLHAKKITGKITILYILIFILLNSEHEDKVFWTKW